VEKPHISALGSLGFHLNSALAHGEGASLSADDVLEALGDGTLANLLNAKVGGLDWTLQLRPGVVGVLMYAAEGSRPRDLNVPDSAGLHWLLGLVVEALQQGFWTNE